MYLQYLEFKSKNEKQMKQILGTFLTVTIIIIIIIIYIRILTFTRIFLKITID